MHTEPPIPKSALVETLAQQFGLPVRGLDFWPSFWTSACYIVQAADGQRCFLKLTPENYTLTIASDPDFYLPLTYALHAHGILPHIAYPLPARDGRFMRTFDGFRMILFNYIEGETIGFGKLPAGIEARLAGLVGRLHRSTSQIRLPHVMAERFDLIFEPDLRRNLARLENLPPSARPGLQALRSLLLPRQNELLGLLERTHALQAYAIGAKKPCVFCHADLHGGNLMLDRSGNLYLIDWEGAILAPPEQDLFFFADHDDFWQHFLPAYEAEFGTRAFTKSGVGVFTGGSATRKHPEFPSSPALGQGVGGGEHRAYTPCESPEFGTARLDSQVFGFYYYRRNLEDLADWVNRILHHNTTAEQDAEDLQGIEQDCLAGWPGLEKKIEQIESCLAKRS
jgi:spectinomycin phosphotransferase